LAFVLPGRGWSGVKLIATGVRHLLPFPFITAHGRRVTLRAPARYKPPGRRGEIPREDVARTFAAALQDQNTYHKTFVTPHNTPALTLVAMVVK